MAPLWRRIGERSVLQLADPPQPATQRIRGDMANIWAADRRQPFYPGMGLAGVLVVVFGFGVTYGLPMARGTFAAPWFVHLHGATALAWVLLYIAQSVLVSTGRTSIHRRLGVSAVPVAGTIWASGIATAVWAARRDLPEMGTVATSSVAGTLTGLSLFLIIVLAALALRHRPDWHKRLLTLATIHLLWPAFFRLRHLFPMIPNPEIILALVVAYAPILIAAFRGDTPGMALCGARALHRAEPRSGAFRPRAASRFWHSPVQFPDLRISTRWR